MALAHPVYWSPSTGLHSQPIIRDSLERTRSGSLCLVASCPFSSSLQSTHCSLGAHEALTSASLSTKIKLLGNHHLKTSKPRRLRYILCVWDQPNIQVSDLFTTQKRHVLIFLRSPYTRWPVLYGNTVIFFNEKSLPCQKGLKF